MTSHISVSAAGSQGIAPLGLSGRAAGKAGGKLTGFAALLAALESALGGAGTPIPPAAGAAPATTANGQGTPPTGFTVPATISAGTPVPATPVAAGADLVAITAAAPAATHAGAAATQPDPTAPTPEGPIVPLDVTAATPATGADDAPTSAAGTPPRLMHDLVAALRDVDAAEQSGRKPDAQTLKRLKHAVDAIANFLAAQPPAPLHAGTPAPATGDGDDAVAAVGGTATAPSAASAAAVPAPGDASSPSTDAAAAKAEALAAAAGTVTDLAAKIDTLANGLGKDQPELTAALQNLAKSLDPGTLAPDTLAQLGLDASAPGAEPQLVAAVNGLAHGKPAVAATTAAQPPLAKPELRLPEGSALTADAPSDGHGLTTAAADKPAIGQAATPSPGASGATSQPATTDGKTDTSPAIPAADKPAQDAVAAADPGVPAATTATATTAAATAGGTAAGPAAITAPATLQAQAAYQQPVAATAINLPQMAIDIVRHTQQGQNHFQIRLDPPDLGRVDVRLQVDASSGSVSAHLTVERAETLDLLRRDSAQLSQAFAQAGLDGGKTDLQFSLGQNAFARQDSGGHGSPGSPYASPPATPDGDADTGAAVVASLYRGTVAPSGLNILV